MTTAQNPRQSDALDAALESLLDREEISIVDGLLSLPGTADAATASDQWARAVKGRLEARLADRVRRTIASPGNMTATAA